MLDPAHPPCLAWPGLHLRPPSRAQYRVPEGQTYKQAAAAVQHAACSAVPGALQQAGLSLLSLECATVPGCVRLWVHAVMWWQRAAPAAAGDGAAAAQPPGAGHGHLQGSRDLEARLPLLEALVAEALGRAGLEALEPVQVRGCHFLGGHCMHPDANALQYNAHQL